MNKIVEFTENGISHKLVTPAWNLTEVLKTIYAQYGAMAFDSVKVSYEIANLVKPEFKPTFDLDSFIW